MSSTARLVGGYTRYEGSKPELESPFQSLPVYVQRWSPVALSNTESSADVHLRSSGRSVFKAKELPALLAPVGLLLFFRHIPPTLYHHWTSSSPRSQPQNASLNLSDQVADNIAHKAGNSYHCSTLAAILGPGSDRALGHPHVVKELKGSRRQVRYTGNLPGTGFVHCRLLVTLRTHIRCFISSNVVAWP